MAVAGRGWWLLPTFLSLLMRIARRSSPNDPPDPVYEREKMWLRSLIFHTTHFLTSNCVRRKAAAARRRCATSRVASRQVAACRRAYKGASQTRRISLEKWLPPSEMCFLSPRDIPQYALDFNLIFVDGVLTPFEKLGLIKSKFVDDLIQR